MEEELEALKTRMQVQETLNEPSEPSLFRKIEDEQQRQAQQIEAMNEIVKKVAQELTGNSI